MQDSRSQTVQALGQRGAAIPAGVTLLVLIVAALAAPLSAADNLLQNGSFPTTTITPWIGQISWSTNNYEPATNSGSLLVSDRSSFNPGYAISECIPIEPGTITTVGGFFRSGMSCSDSNGCGRIGRYYYTGSDCSGNFTVPNASLQISPPGNMWVSKEAPPHQAPAEAHGMKMFVIAQGFASEYYDLLADGLYVYSNSQLPNPTILKAGFETGDFSEWSDWIP